MEKESLEIVMLEPSSDVRIRLLKLVFFGEGCHYQMKDMEISHHVLKVILD